MTQSKEVAHKGENCVRMSFLQYVTIGSEPLKHGIDYFPGNEVGGRKNSRQLRSVLAKSLNYDTTVGKVQ